MRVEVQMHVTCALLAATLSLAGTGLFACGDPGGDAPNPGERDAAAPIGSADAATGDRNSRSDGGVDTADSAGPLARAGAGAAPVAGRGAGDAGAAPDASTEDPGSTPDGAVPGEFEWDLPPGFPIPPEPLDNPMSHAKVELGRFLFYDTLLSDNQTQSCGSCHEQALAFTDGRATGLGSTGQTHPRGSMSLANIAYSSTLTWANPLFFELERQANLPLFGDRPIELGIKSIGAIEERLRAEPLYVDLFAEAFPEEVQPVTAVNLKKALAAFQRTLISGRSPFDRWLYDNEANAISAAAQRGYELFKSSTLRCSECHRGFNFSDHTHWQGKPAFEMPYHNTGLYNVDGAGAYPEPNTGVYDVTLEPADMGHFKVPTLRNIAVTAPYMHDGSIATLDEVIDHYAAGGRNITSGPHAGNGHDNPLKDPRIAGFEITEQQRADLISFLESLTDETFLTDPDFASPWE